MLLFINNRNYFIKSYQLLNDYTTQESKSKNFTKISMDYKIGISLKHFIFSFPSFSLFIFFSILFSSFSLFPPLTPPLNLLPPPPYWSLFWNHLMPTSFGHLLQPIKQPIEVAAPPSSPPSFLFPRLCSSTPRGGGSPRPGEA